MTKNKLTSVFTSHAIEQMAIRLGFHLDISTREELIKKAERITDKETYELSGDSKIFHKKNKKTKYYKIEFKDAEIHDILIEYKEEIKRKYTEETYKELVVILVYRDSICVTVKTNTEKEIFKNLKNFEYSSRCYQEKLFNKYTISN